MNIAPPDELNLVYMYDLDEKHFNEIKKWEMINRQKYLNCLFVDVSDTSSLHDTISVFVIDNEDDYLMFKLRWG